MAGTMQYDAGNDEFDVGADLNLASGKKITAPGGVVLPDGSAATPAARFANDLDLGLYLVSAGVIGISAGGSEVARISSSGISLDGGSNFLGNIVTKNTWTPAFTPTGTAYSSLTYSLQSGHYTRIGSILVATFSLAANTTPSGSSGDLTITGLPVAASSSLGGHGMVAYSNNLTPSTNQTMFLLTVDPSATAINVREYENSGLTGMNSAPSSVIENANPRLDGTIIYHVD